MIIAKQFEFEAAHKLPNNEIYGACQNMHGHTYKLIIKIEGNINEYGWVMNFKELKDIVKTKVIDILDHTYINDLIPLPTAENMVIWIGKQIAPEINKQARLYSIKLYETSSSYAQIIYQ